MIREREVWQRPRPEQLAIALETPREVKDHLGGGEVVQELVDSELSLILDQIAPKAASAS